MVYAFGQPDGGRDEQAEYAASAEHTDHPPHVVYRALRGGNVDEAPCPTVRDAVWLAFQDIMEWKGVPVEIVEDGKVVMKNEEIFRQWYQYLPK